MPRLKTFTALLTLTVLILFTSACHRSSAYSYEHSKSTAVKSIATIGATTAAGAGIGALAGNTLVGAAIGGAVGTTAAFYQSQPSTIVKQLSTQDIQYVAYGDTHTLIVPTDKYFRVNSPRMSNYCPEGMENVIRLLKFYPHCTIYVAGFTDDIGSDSHKKKLSQAQAETMVTYLWANDIPAKNLFGEGYADKHAISDNNIIHGSAQNRRIEIQWDCAPEPVRRMTKFHGKTK